MKLFLAKLFVYMCIGFVIKELPITQPLIAKLCQLIASLTGSFLMLFDASVQINGATLFMQRMNVGYSIEVDRSCTALGFTVTLAAAILAFPNTWVERIKSVLMAILFIQSINALRVMSLLYARAELDAATFNFIHEELWVFLITLLVAIYFIYWTALKTRLVTAQIS